MGVFRSAEIRWFFAGKGSAAVRDWMRTGDLASSQPVRIDAYLLLPGCTTASVKIREGRCEIKVQTSASELQQYPGRVAGHRDGWVKWSTSIPGAADLARQAQGEERWASVRKQRTLRLYSLEGRQPVETTHGGPVLGAGCQVEYSQIQVAIDGKDPPAAWWSFSLEAFGQPGSEADNLDATAHHIFDDGLHVSLPREASMSYPVWLASLPQDSLRADSLRNP